MTFPGAGCLKSGSVGNREAYKWVSKETCEKRYTEEEEASERGIRTRKWSYVPKLALPAGIPSQHPSRCYRSMPES